MSFADLRYLVPEIVLLAAAIVTLFRPVPGGGRSTAFIGAAAAALVAVMALSGEAPGALFGGVFTLDEAARFARVGISALAAVWLLWLAGRGMPGERRDEAVSLALFSAVGGMLIVSASELITLFIALELSTMPAYVLMGYRRRDVIGLEGALKYFLMSMLTSLVMLYGLSFLYGLSGTSFYSGLQLSDDGLLGLVAVVFAFVGMFAKLSAAPFHYWAPDAYAGAPAASVAYVSTVPKLAGTVAAVRLASVIGADISVLALMLAAGAVASMVLGNLAALTQTDVRRLMAYSGVAHTGYVLLALATLTEVGFAAATFYALVYAVPSMAVMLVAAEEGTEVDSFAGLVSRRPMVAWSVLVLLLSLIGIPPLAGFFGKLYLFSAALDSGLVALVVVGVVTSVVSAGYYFRIVKAMFLGQAEGPEQAQDPATDVPSGTESTPAASTWPSTVAVALCVAAVVAMGVAVSPILNLLGASF